MLCNETTIDLWYEGYGAGLTGCTWTETTMGRFFDTWQRAALHAGWKTALEDKAAWKHDQETELVYPESL